MTPSFVVSLMLLSLFLTKAQGIRLEKGFFPARQLRQHVEESNGMKKNNSGNNEEAILCKDEKCTGNVKNRKLTTLPSAPHTISENVETGGNETHPSKIGNTRNDEKVTGKEEGIIKVNKKQKEFVHEDLYINDMDYSPARRKTPIHN